MYRQPEKPLGTTSQSVIVDRLLAELPNGPPRRAPAAQTAPAATARTAVSASTRPVFSQPQRQTARFSRDSRRYPETAAGAWARVGLGVLLGVAVTFWPYQMCGLSLAGYFWGTTTVMVAAIWGAASSWNRRAPVPHIVAIGLLIWGIALTVDQLLQRSGYATASASWTCGG